MAFDFHTKKAVYFNQQFEHSRDYIIPFVEEFLGEEKPLNICEVGSAEAGVLKAFTENGHHTVGIELSEGRVKLAKEFMAEELDKNKVRFFNKDIHDITKEELGNGFDLIILKDVIEHVHDQEKMLRKLRDLLNENGIIFIGMPPWCMPFGGHQQMLQNKWLSKLPYYHILPRPIYKTMLKMGDKRQGVVDGLLEVKDTQISINRFYKISKKAQLKVLKKQFYFINPNYKYKFGLQARKQSAIISAIPYLRDFVTTTAYFVLGK